MQDIAFANGEFMPVAEAKVSLEDRAYQFGDGVYEALLAFDHKPFALKEHLDRWARSCAALSLAGPYERREIESIVRDALARVEGDSLLVYMQVSRGVAPRAHQFPPKETPGVFTLTVRPYPYDRCAYERGEDAALVEDLRWGRCDIKCLNLLPNALAMQQAVEKNCTQAIFHRGGTVTECASANMYIVKDGRVVTHPLTHEILAGVTRAHLLESATALGIPVEERRFTVDELYRADEAFSSSVSRRPTPVVLVEGRPVCDGTPGPVTRALQADYRKRVARECGVMM